MQSTGGGRIVKNIRVMLVGQLITWAIGLTWIIYLPRYLGAVDMGRFAIATAIWAVMSGIINSGTGTHLIKEIARSPEKAPQLLGTALIQRYIIFLICCIPVALYAHLMQYSNETLILIWIVAIGTPAWQTNITFNSIFQGLEVMQYIPFVDIVIKALGLIMSIILMLLNYGINEIAVASVLAATVGVAIQAFILRQYIPIRLTWSNQLSIDMLKKGFPYCLSSLVLLVYGEIDKLILSVMANEQTVGWYSIAASLALTLVFIPNILSTAIFPALTRGADQADNDAVRILRKSLDIVLITGVPIGFGLAIVASPLMELLYQSKFPQSGPVLSIMSIALVFTYIATVLGRFLVAGGQTNTWTLAMVVCIVLAFPLNFVFITWSQQAFGNGAIGGALRLACTEGIMAIFALYMLPRGTLTWDSASTAIRVLCAGSVMVAACWFVRDMFVAIPVLVGVVTYALMILLLRVLKPEDIDLLFNALRGALTALRPYSSGSRASGAGKQP